MPNAGQANNPSGTNGFDGFGTEEPYGQQTQDAQLAAGAPLASGGLASGAIAAPKADQKKAATATASAPAPPSPDQSPGPAPTQLSPVASLWQQIAQDPQASDLVRSYAQQAA